MARAVGEGSRWAGCVGELVEVSGTAGALCWRGLFAAAEVWVGVLMG